MDARLSNIKDRGVAVWACGIRLPDLWRALKAVMEQDRTAGRIWTDFVPNGDLSSDRFMASGPSVGTEATLSLADRGLRYCRWDVGHT